MQAPRSASFWVETSEPVEDVRGGGHHLELTGPAARVTLYRSGREGESAERLHAPQVTRLLDA
jgi:hypothetical protein